MTEYSETYFADNYRSYELQNPPHKIKHYVNELDGLLNVKNPNVLDFGCGRGAFLREAVKDRPDWSLYGSDINRSAISELEHELPDPVALRTSDGLVNPFGDVRFDAVTAFDVLEHLENPRAAIRSMKSWLVPGGVLLFVVPVYDGPTGPIIKVLDKDPTHKQKRDRKFWVDMAESELSSVGWHGIFRYLLGRHYIHVPTDRFRTATPAILVRSRLRTED